MQSQQRKVVLSESNYYSKPNGNISSYTVKNSYNQAKASIICYTRDVREPYSSEVSVGCPDFSNLCADQPRKCHKLKDLCKSCGSSSESSCGCDKSSSCSSSSDSSLLDSEPSLPCKKKHGCKKCDKCNKCDNCDGGCASCGCKQCVDHSVASVLRSIGEEEGGCPVFDDLCADQKRECKELPNLCKSCSSESSSSCSCDKSSSESSCPDCDKNKKSLPVVKSVKKNKKAVDSVTKPEVSSGRGKKFMVSFGSKQGHSWNEYNEGSTSVYINGKNGPVLHLYRDSTYFFCVEQDTVEGDNVEANTFLLTNSPEGGPESALILNSFAPVSKGVVCLKVTDTTPRYFFYQNGKGKMQGGLVIVHDK